MGDVRGVGDDEGTPTYLDFCPLPESISMESSSSSISSATWDTILMASGIILRSSRA